MGSLLDRMFSFLIGSDITQLLGYEQLVIKMSFITMFLIILLYILAIYAEIHNDN